MEMLKRPLFVQIKGLVSPFTVCSWCGVQVPHIEAQEIHVQWHRALGVIPLHAQSEPDDE